MGSQGIVRAPSARLLWHNGGILLKAGYEAIPTDQYLSKSRRPFGCFHFIQIIVLGSVLLELSIYGRMGFGTVSRNFAMLDIWN